MDDLCIHDLAQMLDGRLRLGQMPPLGGGWEPVGPVVVDSRIASPGQVYWGLENSCGTNSAQLPEEAFARGAQGVIFNRGVEPWAGRFSIEVDDGVAALWRLAGCMRRRFLGKMIVVAGDIARATTIAMIQTVLANLGQTTAASADLSPELASPLAMLHLGGEVRYGLLDVETADRVLQKKLLDLACPHIAVVAGASSADETRRVAKLLESLPSEGYAVLPDNTAMRRLADEAPCRVVWYGRGADCDVSASTVRHTGGRLCVKIDGQEIRLASGGRHHLSAVLAAVAVGKILGCEVASCALALEETQPLAGCGEVLQLPGLTMIHDARDGSPAAARAALEMTRDLPVSGRRIVVVGALQTGEAEGVSAHQHLGEEVVTCCGADALVAVGPEAAAIVRGATEAGLCRSQTIGCGDYQEALVWLRRMLQAGDVLLVKSSGMESRCLIEALLNQTMAAA